MQLSECVKGKGRYVVVPDDVEDIGAWLEDWGHAHRLGHAPPNGDTRLGMVGDTRPWIGTRVSAHVGLCELDAARAETSLWITLWTTLWESFSGYPQFPQGHPLGNRGTINYCSSC